MQGFGKFLPMAPFAAHVYEKIRAKEAESRSTTAVIRAEVSIMKGYFSQDFIKLSKDFENFCPWQGNLVRYP